LYLHGFPGGTIGVLNTIFTQMHQKQIIAIKIDAVSLDSTSIKVHPDGTGALKNSGSNPSVNPVGDATPKFIRLPRLFE
jgi:hypothetical protein